MRREWSISQIYHGELPLSLFLLLSAMASAFEIRSTAVGILWICSGGSRGIHAPGKGREEIRLQARALYKRPSAIKAVSLQA
jgi:hypothetical protein